MFLSLSWFVSGSHQEEESEEEEESGETGSEEKLNCSGEMINVPVWMDGVLVPPLHRPVRQQRLLLDKQTTIWWYRTEQF